MFYEIFILALKLHFHTRPTTNQSRPPSSFTQQCDFSDIQERRQYVHKQNMYHTGD